MTDIINKIKRTKKLYLENKKEIEYWLKDSIECMI